MSEIDLRYYVFAVKQNNKPSVLGTAFLVSDQDLGYAVTCHHVVSNREDLELYFEPEEKTIPVELISECSSEEYDIAILKLKAERSASVQILDFPSNMIGLINKDFLSYGFPQGFSGLRITGNIKGFVPSSGKPSVPKSVDQGLLQISTTDVTNGVSGAPLVLSGTTTVVGMILNYYQTNNPQLHDLALAQSMFAIWHVCDRLSNEIPINNRQEWLAHFNFRLDPFFYTDGGMDTQLYEYFYRVPYFYEIMNNLKTTIVFGSSGCGKSSLRNVIEKTYSEEETCFPVVMVNFQALVNKARQGTNISIDDHIILLIKATIGCLASLINKVKVLAPKNGTLDVERIRLMKQTLYCFVNLYGDDAVIRKDVQKFLGVENSSSADIPEDQEERLYLFCRHLKELLGRDSICFLIDPEGDIAQDISVAWKVLEPLLSTDLRRFLSEGIVFKFFLNQNLEDTVSQLLWIVQRKKDIIFYPLEWSPEKLSDLLRERLKLSSNAKPPYVSLAQISEVPNLDELVLQHSAGKPRELIFICNRIISLHCSQRIDRKKPLITQDTVNKALNDLVLKQPASIGLRIVRGEESIDNFTVRELIANGENKWVEFKSTMRWNLKAGKRDAEIEKAVAKSLSGFMNAGGGVLVLGVDSLGNAIGLENDFKTLGKDKQNEDGFESAFSDLVNNYLELRVRQNISEILFIGYGLHRVCVVQVTRSPTPVFFSDSGGREYEFYTRVGNSTRRLNLKSALSYIKTWSPEH